MAENVEYSLQSGLHFTLRVGSSVRWAGAAMEMHLELLGSIEKSAQLQLAFGIVEPYLR